MQVPLRQAEAEPAFGGKAASLAKAMRAGLPVPPGFAIGHLGVNRIIEHDAEALASLRGFFDGMRPPLAVRSSAVGEDSERASFAGQHLTVLNVTDFAQLTDAIGRVVASVSGGGAAYRKRLGIDGGPRMGIVVQELLNPDSAGVIFTRNPLTGIRERVVEAAWGLGEAVVSGLVIPDHYRLDADGGLVECRIGDKDLILRIRPDGGTEEVEVEPDRRGARVLDDVALRALHDLASLCESEYGANLDIEWCFVGPELFLLQCRSITAIG